MGDILQIPEAAQLLLKVEKGEVELPLAIEKLQEILKGTQTEKEIVTKMNDLDTMGFDMSRLAYQHPNGENQLNPLFEAKIVERLSQDGDIPELRIGALPEGCKPAVPILTYSTDPIVIGLQLEKASEYVLNALEEQNQRYIKSCEENQFLVPPSKPIDLQGIYEVGKTPLLLNVDPMGPKEINSLTAQRKRTLAHKCIGTTQGRRSCIPPIEALLRKRFSDEGISIAVGDYKNTHTCTWQIETWGPEDMSENFNPITQAAESFYNAFKEVSNKDVKSAYMYIRPINGYSDRIFGWKCTFDF